MSSSTALSAVGFAGAGGPAADILAMPPRLLDLLPIAIYACDASGRVRWFNRRAAALWGRTPRPGDDVERYCGALRLYHPDGRPMPHDTTPMAYALAHGVPMHDKDAVIERPDGTRITVMVHIDPIFDADGTLIGAINCFHETTELKRAEARQKTLIDELNHRVRNTLAIVQSLALQTFGHAEVARDLRQAFQERLLALSRAHDRLTDSHWQSAQMHALVRDIVLPFGDEESVTRVHAGGDPVELSSRQALAMTMILHELGTNAAKYGSLSTPDGRLDVHWQVHAGENGPTLAIDWRESGGPPVQPPTRRGFGSRLFERSIVAELGGTGTLAFEPEGLHCTMSIPLQAGRR